MRLFSALATALVVAGLAMPASAASEKMDHKKVTKMVAKKKAAAPVVINVKLWDKNMAAVDMSKNMGLGMA
jgi:hypothetical protein